MSARYTGLVEQYRDRLPLPANARAVSLCEGNTPLIRLNNIPRELGFKGALYVKFEGLNPTGSFKDRGMTVAVTEAVHRGSKAVICASTGNTSASAAAYAARAGITAFVLIPEGKIAAGKLAQAVMHGAVVLQIKGNFDDGMRLVKEVAQDVPVAIVNSINPYRLHGQKTAAFEIIEALGRDLHDSAEPVAHRDVGVLQAVPGQGADHRVGRGNLAALDVTQRAGDRGGRRRLAEHALVSRQQLLRGEDFRVAAFVEPAVRLLLRGPGQVPALRMADADRGGDGFRMLDRLAAQERRRAGGLEPRHARP